MSRPTEKDLMQFNDEIAYWVRVLLLDELMYNNGKVLDSNLIGEITKRVIEKLKDKF